LSHGPSPPEDVSIPSRITRSIGRIPTASTVCRGTRYAGRRGPWGSSSWGSPAAGRCRPSWKIATRAEVLCSFCSGWPYSAIGVTPKLFFMPSVTPAVAWFFILASET
jgi:hypothetical protein